MAVAEPEDAYFSAAMTPAKEASESATAEWWRSKASEKTRRFHCVMRYTRVRALWSYDFASLERKSIWFVCESLLFLSDPSLKTLHRTVYWRNFFSLEGILLKWWALLLGKSAFIFSRYPFQSTLSREKKKRQHKQLFRKFRFAAKRGSSVETSYLQTA